MRPNNEHHCCSTLFLRGCLAPIGAHSRRSYRQKITTNFSVISKQLRAHARRKVTAASVLRSMPTSWSIGAPLMGIRSTMMDGDVRSYAAADRLAGSAWC